jgi:hypothetical protein
VIVLIERTACDFTSRALIASLTAPVVPETASAAMVLQPAAKQRAAAMSNPFPIW